MTAASLEPPLTDLVHVDVSTAGTTVTVVVSGEVDSSSASVLRTELDDALDAAPAELVIDLTAVEFLDSAGLSALAGAHRRAVTEGVHLRVLASGRAVVRPMQITGLWELLGAERIEAGISSVS